MKYVTSSSLLMVVLPAWIGCSSSGITDPDPSTSDTGTTVGDATPGGTGGGGGSNNEPPKSTFTETTFMLDSLEVVEEDDLDGDGYTDNNLPIVISLVELTVGADLFSLDLINESLNESLYPDNIVLFDAAYTSPDLAVGVLFGSDTGGGLDVDPASYDANGVPLNVLDGEFFDQTRFSANASATVDFPLTLVPDTPAANITFHDLELTGTMDGLSSAGTMYTVIPVNQVVEEVAEPLIPAEGVEIFGSWMTKDEVMDLIWELAPLLGDVDLGDGEMGVSSMLQYTAVPTTIE